jgi:SAM-dependent methyltransferase
VLTVRYDRLGLKAGDRVLDLGSGGGRHAYEAMRRGGVVTALDADAAGIKDVSAMMTAIRAEEPSVTRRGGTGAAVAGDARGLPFSSGVFDRIIAAEVLEHILEDRLAVAELARVLRPGGTMAVTVPRWWPELLTWAISDDYHNAPGGHIRIYRRAALIGRLTAAGLECYGRHHAHALHSPYWWLRSAVGVRDEEHPLVRAYHRLLVWDITAHTPLTRVPEALLNPVLGKSLVLYVRKPGGAEASPTVGPG